eukprot:495217-Pyramimonas_sp.AAC.1
MTTRRCGRSSPQQQIVSATMWRSVEPSRVSGPLLWGASFQDRGMRNDSRDAVAVAITFRG